MNPVTEPLFYYKITGRETPEGGAVRILGCRTLDTGVEVPESIDGCPVTEIAPYAFSERRAWQEEGQWTGKQGEQDMPPLLCGTRLEEITLPSALTRIGNYAFYNCYELKKLTCHSTVGDLGSGLFTGCGKLTEIDITVVRDEKSCLKEMLSELRQTLTVLLREPRGTALLIFPEFYEESVENTPARILFTQTHGCGHMYRYCFEQTHFLFREYDSLFPHVRVQESEELAVNLALGRMRYPLELSGAAKEIYEQYIREHWPAAGAAVLKLRDMEVLEWLVTAFRPQKESVERLIAIAEASRDTEALSYLMDYRHEHFKAKKRRFEL